MWSVFAEGTTARVYGLDIVASDVEVVGGSGPTQVGGGPAPLRRPRSSESWPGHAVVPSTDGVRPHDRRTRSDHVLKIFATCSLDSRARMALRGQIVRDASSTITATMSSSMFGSKGEGNLDRRVEPMDERRRADRGAGDEIEATATSTGDEKRRLRLRQGAQNRQFLAGARHRRAGRGKGRRGQGRRPTRSPSAASAAPPVLPDGRAPRRGWRGHDRSRSRSASPATARMERHRPLRRRAPGAGRRGGRGRRADTARCHARDLRRPGRTSAPSWTWRARQGLVGVRGRAWARRAGWVDRLARRRQRVGEGGPRGHREGQGHAEPEGPRNHPGPGVRRRCTAWRCGRALLLSPLWCSSSPPGVHGFCTRARSRATVRARSEPGPPPGPNHGESPSASTWTGARIALALRPTTRRRARRWCRRWRWRGPDRHRRAREPFWARSSASAWPRPVGAERQLVTPRGGASAGVPGGTEDQGGRALHRGGRPAHSPVP